MQTEANDDELRQSLDDYVAAWNARDIDRIAALFAENGRYGEFGEGKVLSGRAAIADHLRGLLSSVSNLRLSVSARPFCAADRVFFKWTMRGTISGFAARLATSEPFELRGATVLVFEDGRISRAADSFEVRNGRDYPPSGPSPSSSEAPYPGRMQAREDPPEDNICFGE